VTFLIGASLSVFVADVLEALFAGGSGLGPWVMVGVCEETAKALAFCWLLRDQRLRGEIHGLILGAAAGMGFAAMETAGYGFAFFLHGSSMLDGTSIPDGISSMTGELVARMALAAFGHGVWTAIIGAAIWRDRGASTFKLTRGVALAFGIAVTLHALWDASTWFIPVSAILGLLVLRFLIGESVSRARLGPAAPAPEPLDQALRAYFRHLFHRAKRLATIPQNPR
jgi:RsiW-degrading membrane proteinase PrsW (M82 family)